MGHRMNDYLLKPIIIDNEFGLHVVCNDNMTVIFVIDRIFHKRNPRTRNPIYSFTHKFIKEKTKWNKHKCYNCGKHNAWRPVYHDGKLTGYICDSCDYEIL